MHALNTLFLLVEVALTNAGPCPWLHLPLCVGLLACYLGVAYITHATQGFYSASPSPPSRLTIASNTHRAPAAYSFLDPAKEHARLAAYIVGIALAECIAFLLARGATWARTRLVRRFSRARPPRDDAPSEDWVEVEVGSSVAHAV